MINIFMTQYNSSNKSWNFTIDNISSYNNSDITFNVNDSGLETLRIVNNDHRPLRIKTTPLDKNSVIVQDANRSSSNSFIGGLDGKWNGTTVATMLIMTGTDTTNKNNGYIKFHTSSNGGDLYGNDTERLRITEDGYVGIGTTDPTQKLHVNGNIYSSGNLYVNEIYCNKIISANDNNCYIVFQDGNSSDSNYEIWMNSAGAISQNIVQDKANGETMIRGIGSIVHSDDRLKHNETYINNSLDIIKKLNPYTYDMTYKFYDASYVGDISDVHYYRAGFIAQQIREIEEISFCCIGEEYDSSNNPTPLGIDYNSLFTYNIAATKELHIIVEEQNTKINNLETENILLKQENNLIKSKLNEILSEMGKETI